MTISNCSYVRVSLKSRNSKTGTKINNPNKRVVCLFLLTKVPQLFNYLSKTYLVQRTSNENCFHHLRSSHAVINNIMLHQIVSCSFRRITIFQVKYFSRLKVPQPLPLSKNADNVSFPPPPPRDPLEAQHRDKWTGLIVYDYICVLFSLCLTFSLSIDLVQL